MPTQTTKPIARLGLWGRVLLASATAVLLLPGAVGAQDEGASALSLDEAVRTIREERRAVSEQNAERVRRFIDKRDQQEAKLAAIRENVTQAEKEAARLEGVRNENTRKLEELKGQLAERKGEFSELFGAARSAAADLKERLDQSLISAQFPGRGETLAEIAEAETLPSIEQLETLWFTLLQQANQQAKVVTFEAPVVGTDNQPSRRTVTRAGPFVAVAGDRFLRFGNGQLKYLARQPGGGANAAAERVSGSQGQDGFVAGVIDPSLGTLLSQVVAAPTPRERIDQGGGIGYIIIAVTIAGVLLALFKLLTLAWTSRRVHAQKGSDTISDRNPLGRVMRAYETNRDADIETLQLKLDDAVLKETPRLDRGLGIVKVLAAVTPLMGLLGTVIGMIITFQAITLFGTGDPKLMAGGISQALVTTVLGLIGAIPLLLLHAFASGASRRIAQVLEEQSAGLVADYAERHDRPVQGA